MMSHQLDREKKNENFSQLDFYRKSLRPKAEKYRHEITHLSSDLYVNNTRIQETLQLAVFALRQKIDKTADHMLHPYKEHIYLEDFQYHMENYVFRIFSYRDKLSFFVLHALQLEKINTNDGVLNALMKDAQIQKLGLDKDLAVFRRGTMHYLLEKRRRLTHKLYYGHSLEILPLRQQSPGKDENRFYKQQLAGIRREARQALSAQMQLWETNYSVCQKILGTLR